MDAITEQLQTARRAGRPPPPPPPAGEPDKPRTTPNPGIIHDKPPVAKQGQPPSPRLDNTGAATKITKTVHAFARL